LFNLSYSQLDKLAKIGDSGD